VDWRACVFQRQPCVKRSTIERKNDVNAYTNKNLDTFLFGGAAPILQWIEQEGRRKGGEPGFALRCCQRVSLQGVLRFERLEVVVAEEAAVL